MTERCKRNPCCGDYLDCTAPPQFKAGESYEDYQRRIAKPASEPAGGVRETLEQARRETAWALNKWKSTAFTPELVETIFTGPAMQKLLAAALSSSAAPAGEPVAWLQEVHGDLRMSQERWKDQGAFPVYRAAHPAPATVEEIVRLRASLAECAHYIISPLRLSDDREEAARRADIYARAVAALAPATEGRKS